MAHASPKTRRIRRLRREVSKAYRFLDLVAKQRDALRQLVIEEKTENERLKAEAKPKEEPSVNADSTEVQG